MNERSSLATDQNHEYSNYLTDLMLDLEINSVYIVKCVLFNNNY